MTNGEKSGHAIATIPAGTWGGDHAVLEASDSGASLQFDCAHGAIAGPLAVDADGRFRISGDFVREHGGPIRRGENERREAVFYTGRIQGRTMSLTVELPAREAPMPRFDLELGSPGRIVRCR